MDFIYDLETQNESFIKIALEMNATGAHKYMEVLKLYDRRLIGVDPHYPNLSNESREAIVKECKVNQWYYLREVFRTPDGARYQLTRSKLAMLIGAL